MSGLGACIRNWQGEVVAIKADVLPVGTSNLAEAQALLAGLILAKRCNVSSIHIEGDSLLSLIIFSYLETSLYPSTMLGFN